MKRILFFGLITSVNGMISCGSNQWPSADQDLFLDECAEEGGGSSYCKCYLEGVMEKYPNPDDAKKMDFETAVEIAAKCE